MDSLPGNPHTDCTLLFFLERAFPQLFLGVKVHYNQHLQVNSCVSDCYGLKISDSAAAIKTRAAVNVIVCRKLTVILTQGDH